MTRNDFKLVQGQQLVVYSEKSEADLGETEFNAGQHNS